MTSLDEIELKSPDLLLSGESVVNVIKRRCPEVLKPEELLTHDIDYILYMLRISSYGSSLEISLTHDCNEEYEKVKSKLIESGEYHPDHPDLPKLYELKELEYVLNLDEQVSRVMNITKNDISKRFNFSISTGQVITIMPARYSHVMEYLAEVSNELDTSELINIRKIVENRKIMEDVDNTKESLINNITMAAPNTNTTKKVVDIIKGLDGDLIEGTLNKLDELISFNEKSNSEKQAANIDKFYSKMILSVDGITDKKSIIEWLSQLGIMDKKKIGERISNTSEGWGVPNTATIECRICKEKVERPLDLNPISFFS